MLSVSSFEFSQRDLLGHGAFALVFKGRRKKDHLPVAVKQIALKSVPGKLSSIRQKEISILKDLKNPHIVQLYDYQETPSDIFLVMEYCNGGDMGDYLIAKKTLSESSIRHLSRHIVLALQTLFELHIIHRDIKPQNLLLSYPSPPLSSSSSSRGGHAKPAFTDSIIKLADFGFARYLTGADMAATLCGSPLYMAPEILIGRRYDNSADLWSVGTILFQCLAGSAPFLASNPHTLRRRYEREKLVPKIPEGTSRHLRDLVTKLLKKNPQARLSYSDFFAHDFLKDPSTLAADPMLTFHPSQAVKSSPVPIRRQPDHHHPHSSHQHSISPHRASSIEVSSFSPSSGPPLSHRVGSQASLPYYSAQSPSTDVTDQGFVLVDFPGRSRRCSTSSNGSGNYASGRSSGRNSVPGHTHSGHTPSSASGSLSRYTSLTTPFYQPQPGTRQREDMATTPVNKNPQSQSRTNYYGSSSSIPGSVPGQMGPSPPGLLPFGQLIPPAHSPASNHSRNRTSPGTTSSPLSTPPSSSSPGSHTLHYTGTKGALARRNSGTKLSALAEERGKKKKITNKKSGGTPSEKTSSGGFDIITQSCLLGFSDGEDGDDLDLEEANFPLSLTASLSSSTSVDQEDTDGKGAGSKGEGSLGVECSGNTLQFVGKDAVHFAPRPRSSSGTWGEQDSKQQLGNIARRASSFSYQRNPRLSQQLAAVNTKASKLSAHSDPFDPKFQTPPPSLSSEIIAIKAPFLFSGAASDDHVPSRSSGKLQGGGALPHEEGEEERSVGVGFGSLNLSDMMDLLVVVREMHAMAKARQGPILLLSTSANLSESGIAGQKRRCSEQVVLYAKAISLADTLATRFGVELATNSEDPPGRMKKVMEEVETLRSSCLLEAKQLREEMLSSKENGWNNEANVSAEKLLFLEALDMCKAALLDEKSVEALECVKRYRRAKTLFQHLLSEARTQNDKQILQKYLQSAQARIHLLS